MNKSSVRAGVAALLFVAGVGTGFLVARQLQAISSPTEDAPRIRFRPGDEHVFDDPPKWTEWQYPGSKVVDSGGGGDYTDMKIKHSVGQRAVLTTPDDFDQVCEYYKKKCDL